MSYFARCDELPGWAAHVPDDWGRNWLKWSVDISTKRPTEAEQEVLPYISNEDIASWTGKLLTEEPKPAEADSRRFQKGDVLFNKLRPYLAKVYHATFDGVSSGELLCLRPSEAVEPRFLFYVLVSKGFIDVIDAETFGSKMPRADWEIVGHQPLPLPPLETQQRIAQFLDEKTARIDGLIEKKRALLDRLAEKRQALVTRAVTKGLNPDAPMKPSGIDWLGDVPAHWEVKRLRYVVRLLSGSTPTTGVSEYWDGKIPWISPKDMKSDAISDSIDKVTRLAIEACRLREFRESNAVIVVRGMILARRIPIAVASGVYTINQDMKVMESKGLASPEFLQMYLSAIESYLMTLVAEAGHGTKALRTDVLLDAPTLIPPPSEQTEIVKQVEAQRSLTDSTKQRIQALADRLTEYRTALITVAVTGKLEK
jgi:type I restriction enzyme, S subunit